MEQKTFQTAIYVFFGVLFLGGFLSLALYGYFKKVEQEEVGTATSVPDIVIWGTIDRRQVSPIIRQLSTRQSPDKKYGSLSYVEKDPDTIRNAYVKAVALGNSPDLLLLDHPTLLTLTDTVRLIPFSYLPLAQYQQIFIPAADLLVRERGGYLGFPLLADTMVLYYNENLRLRDGIHDIPTRWSDFTDDTLAAIIKERRETDRSVIPLGAYSNYRNAVDLVSALVLQAKESDAGLTAASAENALRFYTSFANPRSSVYAWNVST